MELKDRVRQAIAVTKVNDKDLAALLYAHFAEHYGPPEAGDKFWEARIAKETETALDLIAQAAVEELQT